MAYDQEACLDVLAEHDFGFVHQVLSRNSFQVIDLE